MKQTNISIFIPHNGCPHRCSFCDQRKISGSEKAPTADEVRALLSEQQPRLKEADTSAQIAFFGGSFTAVERGYMISLLEAAAEFTEKFPEQYNGIRCSTRPDAIDRETLDILKSFGMTAIELGAQSMSDEVLEANQRGHTARQVGEASRLIKEYGFSLGLQMMTGLYKDTPERCIETARRFIELKCDTVRIYPTVILKGTALGELYTRGEYESFGFEETIELCAELLKMFAGAGIPVIRLGLHASAEVEKNRLGGAYHPALKEIVESRIFFGEMKKQLLTREKGRYTVYTDGRNISRVVGQKRANIKAFEELGYKIEIKPRKGEYITVE